MITKFLFEICIDEKLLFLRQVPLFFGCRDLKLSEVVGVGAGQNVPQVESAGPVGA